MIASESIPRWSGGTHTAIAWPGGIALVSGTLPIGSAERIWTRLHRDSQLGTFLKALAECTGTGFLDLPAFAIAVLDGPKCHVAVRGDVGIEVLLPQQVETINGGGITTWAERVFVEPLAVRLTRREAADTDLEGPMADGVVPASVITLGEFAPGPGGAAPGAVKSAAVVTTPAVATEAAAEVIPDTHTPADPVVPSHVADRPTDMQETLAEEEEPEAAPEIIAAAHEAQEPPGAVARPEPVQVQRRRPNPYESLWDVSMAVDIEAAAVRAEKDAGDQGEAPASNADRDEQLSGETVLDEGQAEVVMAGPAGQSVLARFCDRGHANPPERGDCFACGSPVSGDARLAMRPQLGWIRVEGGETVPLRGPIIAGRNPSTAAMKSAETPRLLALPHAHISSNHLAFLIEGWRVMIRDLGSSNGTYLRRHGKPPVRLPEQSFPLVPGDLIDLGKGIFIHLDRIP